MLPIWKYQHFQKTSEKVLHTGQNMKIYGNKSNSKSKRDQMKWLIKP